MTAGVSPSSLLGNAMIVEKAREAFGLDVPAVALFPALEDPLKDPHGRESANPDGLLQRCIGTLKRELPELVVVTDVALDPAAAVIG